MFYLWLALFFSVQDNIQTLREDRLITDYQDSGTTGYLMSHPEFNFGSGTSNYSRHGSQMETVSYISLTLPATATRLHINFIHFNIGTYNISQCERTLLNENLQDEFIIYHSNLNKAYSCVGGESSPTARTISLQSNRLIGQLIVRKTRGNYSGFLIRYHSKCTPL